MLVAMAVFLGYQYVINKVFPPRRQAPTPVAAPGLEQPAPAPPATTTTAPGPTTAPVATAPERTYFMTAGVDSEPIMLGGREGDALRIRLNPRGAALATLEFTALEAKGRFVHRAAPDSEEPYQLLAPVDNGERVYYSFATYRIWIEERSGQVWNQSWRLDDLPWVVSEKSADKVVFTTALGTGSQGEELLRLTKSYVLRPGKPVLNLELSVENVGSDPLKVRVEQDGPLGIRQENPQYDMRRLLTAQYTSRGIELNKGRQYSELQKATLDPLAGPLQLLRPDKGPFLWTVLANKYFGVYTRPVAITGDFQDYVVGVTGLVADPHAVARAGDLRAHGDLLARLATRSTVLSPGAGLRCPFEIYAGPKDAEHLRQADPVYADKTKLYYQLAQSADTRCFCTFLWLEELMVWLLGKIHLVVRNYGVAIIILVIIIRTLLHPLSVFQQKSMFRMQEAMARIQPKMEAIKQKYPNDKVKQNQETMKLFGEEGVNPAANFVSFLPLFLQMPILVALWTALNTDIHLRHAPFDGWWIVDLSAPDALLTFSPPITIPILGWLPLIGGWFSNVTSLNLLPIVMGVSMWLQQKYMPKPHVKAKLEAARQKAAEQSKSKSGLSPQDQLRQQQIMAYLMAILFPLMFYRMPSGLNLYWLSTNIFGIFESLVIRRQIDREKQRRELEGPHPQVRRPGLVGRFFKHIAAQAEELQRKADVLSRTADGKRKDRKRP
jgi:YidC/Oxa1 family membrane protein insertase